METALSRSGVNNAIYDQLGDRWYDAADDPVALLRAESRLHTPWIASYLRHDATILDVGCGAGFVSNALALRGHHVVGLDIAADALAVARAHDPTGLVQYDQGDALQLPYPDGHFDAVCAMDFLEHIDDMDRAISEASRVLAPGGHLFFHTFNRNPLSWLIVIKGVEWFVKNTPRDLHVLSLFRKPSEVADTCARHGLSVVELRGSRPRINGAFLRMLLTRVVPANFDFTFCRSTLLGYCGLATKPG